MSGALHRGIIEAIYRAAIEKVEAGAAVRRVLSRPASDALRVGATSFSIGAEGVWAIAIGKAGCQMMAAVEDITGDHFADGLVVTKSIPSAVSVRSTVLIGSHPVPDQRSLAAGRALVEFIARIPHGALVLCLISGGGSALVESLRPGATLPELSEVTRTLLGAGASISELNAVRSRLSRLKGGGLLDLLNGRTVVNLIVSDVLGNPLPVIASGPTVKPTAGLSAEEVVRRYDLDLTLSDVASVDSIPPALTLVIADLQTAVEAAAAEARRRGLATYVLTSSVDIEARLAGRLFAGIVADTSAAHTSFLTPCCLLAGGETVVDVRGDGVGGRNCESAVAAAIRLTGVDDCAVGCLATDGDDGTSGAAGGIVDGATLDDIMSAQAALDGSDSHTWLAERGAALTTGPTGTNVNDLLIGVVAPANWTGR